MARIARRYFVPSNATSKFVDRIRGRLIFGLLTKSNIQDALEFAVAASCLKQSSPGYFNLVAVEAHPAKFSDLKFKIRMKLQLRSYQKEGVQAWIDHSCQGNVYLPTGSGKTWVALKAMEHVKQSTLVGMPTIDLMNQWYGLIADAFEI